MDKTNILLTALWINLLVWFSNVCYCATRMAAWVIDELSFCCPKNYSLDEVGYLGLFLTLADCISWKLRCKVHKNPFCLTWFSLRAKLTKMLSCTFFCSETEKIRWSYREEWGGWWFGRHSSFTASPHHTRRKKRYSSTTEHDTGVNRGPTGCAYTVFCYGNISEQRITLLLMTSSRCYSLGKY